MLQTHHNPTKKASVFFISTWLHTMKYEQKSNVVLLRIARLTASIIKLVHAKIISENISTRSYTQKEERKIGKRSHVSVERGSARQDESQRHEQGGPR